MKKGKKEKAPLEFPIGEFPNRTTQQEHMTHNPPTGPANGEEGSNRPTVPDEFTDTGGTMEDFALASDPVAKILKRV